MRSVLSNTKWWECMWRESERTPHMSAVFCAHCETWAESMCGKEGQEEVLADQHHCAALYGSAPCSPQLGKGAGQCQWGKGLCHRIPMKGNTLGHITQMRRVLSEPRSLCPLDWPDMRGGSLDLRSECTTVKLLSPGGHCTKICTTGLRSDLIFFL